MGVLALPVVDGTPDAPGTAADWGGIADGEALNEGAEVGWDDGAGVGSCPDGGVGCWRGDDRCTDEAGLTGR